jgi:hypothetical protein
MGYQGRGCHTKVAFFIKHDFGMQGFRKAATTFAEDFETN